MGSMASALGYNQQPPSPALSDNASNITQYPPSIFPLDSVAGMADSAPNPQQFQAMMSLFLAAALSQRNYLLESDPERSNDSRTTPYHHYQASTVCPPNLGLHSMNNGYGESYIQQRARGESGGGPHRFSGVASGLDLEHRRSSPHDAHMLGDLPSSGFSNRPSTQSARYSPPPSSLRRRNHLPESQSSLLHGHPTYERPAGHSNSSSPHTPPRSPTRHENTSWLLRISNTLNSTTLWGWLIALFAIPCLLTLGGAFIQGFHEAHHSPCLSQSQTWFTSAFLYTTNNALAIILDTYFTIASIFKERANISPRHGGSTFPAAKKRRGSFKMAVVSSFSILLLAVSSIVVAAFSQNISSFLLGVAGGLLSYLISLEGVIQNELLEPHAGGP